MAAVTHRHSTRITHFKQAMEVSPDKFPKYYVNDFEVHRKPLKSNQEEKPRTHPLQAVILSLRLLGRIPVSRTESGEFYFSIRSWSMVYCVVSLAVQLVMTGILVREYFWSKARWSNVDTTVASLMNAILLLTTFHPLLFTWKHSRDIAKALNRWRLLQDSFREVTANQVSSELLDNSYIVVTSLMLYLILAEFLPIVYFYAKNAGQQDKISTSLFTVFFTPFCYVKLILCLWLFFTHSVSQAAKALKTSLTETMTRDPSTVRIRFHRSLWLEVHNYAYAMTSALGSTLRAYMFSLVFALYLSFYANMISLADGSSVKINLLLQLAYRAYPTFLLNNASYLAEEQIGRDFTVNILSFNYSEFSEDQLEEVDLFLDTIENSPERFSFEQMVKSNRQTTLAILDLALTITVVLLQFRAST